mgnify:CR=1 FL=1
MDAEPCERAVAHDPVRDSRIEQDGILDSNRTDGGACPPSIPTRPAGTSPSSIAASPNFCGGQLAGRAPSSARRSPNLPAPLCVSTEGSMSRRKRERPVMARAEAAAREAILKAAVRAGCEE